MHTYIHAYAYIPFDKMHETITYQNIHVYPFTHTAIDRYKRKTCTLNQKSLIKPLTCNHGPKYHSDGHVISFLEVLKEVVPDCEAPPYEM